MTDDGGQTGRTAHIPGADRDDLNHWMTMFDSLDDWEVDAVLDGSAADSGLGPVAEVILRLRESAAQEPVPPMSLSLRAQLERGGPLEEPARRAVRGALVKAVAVAAAVTVVGLFGAGAAQNRLPTGVQDVVSSTAELVGIHVPRSEDHHVDGGSTEDHGDATSGDQQRSGQGASDGSDPGPGGTTPGGATPAEPGTPGDREPAVPAVPADGNGRVGENSPPSTVPGAGGPKAGSAGGRGDSSATIPPRGVEKLDVSNKVAENKAAERTEG